MGQVDAGLVTRCLVGVEGEGVAVVELDRSVRERAEPEFWPLQIDQNSDRTAVAAFDVADRRDQLAHLVMRCVAHVDAEDIGSRLEQTADHGAVG